MNHVNVYGPQASGKTRNAEKLRKKYNCVWVVDEDLLTPTGLDETFRIQGRLLYLTIEPIPGMTSIPIEEALNGGKTEALAAIEALNRHPAVEHSLRDAVCGIAEMQDLCHSLAAHAGWWDNIDPEEPMVACTKIALIHSEISEALEGVRKDTMDSHLLHRKTEEVELADAIIRIFDLAQARGLDLAGAMIEKLAWNTTREDHKRENRAKPGGKSV